MQRCRSVRMFLVFALVWGLALLVAGQPVQAAVSGRNLPADGKVLFFMGQDTTTLSEYKRDVLNAGSGAPQPGGVTLYTNLLLGGNPPALAGMDGTANWGAGDVNFDTTLGQYPGAALAVGLYLSDASSGCGNQPLRAIIGRNDADVTAGSPNLITQYRAKVDELVNKLKGYNRPVFLRIGYEYDGPWNCYNSDFYKEAFRYIKGRIDALGAAKVATVWQSAAWPIDEFPDHPEYNYLITAANHFDVWYPGDQYVDWVSLSSFYNAGSTATQWGCRGYAVAPKALQDRVLNFARAHSKPVMIAEASPQGYATGAQTKSCIFSKAPQSASASTIWSEWYAPFFASIEANRDVIRAVAYINTHWDSQPLWACNGAVGQTGCANGYWGDSRVQANTTIRASFLNELKKPIYVNGSGAVPTATPAGPNPTATPSGPNPTATPAAPTATPVNNTITIPGTVTATSFGGSKSFSVNVTSAGSYYLVITYTSTAASKLISVQFNGTSTAGATGAGSGLSYQTIDFSSVSAGTKTLTIAAESGVSITRVVAYKR